MRIIDGDALVEDFKNDYLNLYMDGLKGTPRERSISIANVVERIEDAPMLSEEDINKELFKIEKIVCKIEDQDLLEKYKKVCGELHIYGENKVTFIDTPKTQYIEKDIAKVFQNMAYRRGVRALNDMLTEYLHIKAQSNESISCFEMLTMLSSFTTECFAKGKNIDEEIATV